MNQALYAHMNNKRKRKKKSSQARCWWPTPVILAIQKAEIRRITVWSWPWENSLWEPILKIPNTKRAGRVAQVAECPPSKHEALSSTPSTTQKKKKIKPGEVVHAYNPSYWGAGGRKTVV
jgi:hypothetical protein